MPNKYKEEVLRGLWDSYGSRIDKTAIPDFQTFQGKFDDPNFRDRSFAFFGQDLGIPDQYAWKDYLEGDAWKPQGVGDVLRAVPELATSLISGGVESGAMALQAVRGAIPEKKEPAFLREWQEETEAFAAKLRMDPKGVRALGQLGMDAYQAAESVGQSLSLYAPLTYGAAAVGALVGSAGGPAGTAAGAQVGRYVGAGLNALVYFGAQYQDFLDDVRDQGVVNGLGGEELDALVDSMKTEALKYGAAESGPELLFGLVLPKLTGFAGEEAAAKMLNKPISDLIRKNATKGAIARFGAGAIGVAGVEGVTEAASQYMQNEIRKQTGLLSYDPSSAHAAWQAFRVGALAGGAMGAATSAHDAVQFAQELRLQDNVDSYEQLKSYQEANGELTDGAALIYTAQRRIQPMFRTGQQVVKITDYQAEGGPVQEVGVDKIWTVKDKTRSGGYLVENAATREQQEVPGALLNFVDGQMSGTPALFENQLAFLFRTQENHKASQMMGGKLSADPRKRDIEAQQIAHLLTSAISGLVETTTDMTPAEFFSKFKLKVDPFNRPDVSHFKGELVKMSPGLKALELIRSDPRAELANNLMKDETIGHALGQRLLDSNISIQKVAEMKPLERSLWIADLLGISTEMVKSADFRGQAGTQIQNISGGFVSGGQVTLNEAVLNTEEKAAKTFNHELMHTLDYMIRNEEGTYWGIDVLKPMEEFKTKMLGFGQKLKSRFVELMGREMTKVDEDAIDYGTDANEFLQKIKNSPPSENNVRAEARRLAMDLWLRGGGAREFVEQEWSELAQVMERQQLTLLTNMLNQSGSDEVTNVLLQNRPVPEGPNEVLGAVKFQALAPSLMKLFAGADVETALHEIAHVLFELQGGYEGALLQQAESAGVVPSLENLVLVPENLRYSMRHEAFVSSFLQFIKEGKWPVDGQWARDMQVLGEFIQSAYQRGLVAHESGTEQTLTPEQRVFFENTFFNMFASMAAHEGDQTNAEETRELVAAQKDPDTKKWFDKVAEFFITGHDYARRGMQEVAEAMRGWASIHDDTQMVFRGFARHIWNKTAGVTFEVGGKPQDAQALLARYVDDNARWVEVLTGLDEGKMAEWKDKSEWGKIKEAEAKAAETEVWKALQPMREEVQAFFRQVELDLKARGILKTGFYEWKAGWAEKQADHYKSRGNMEKANAFLEMAQDLRSGNYNFAPIPLAWLMKQMNADHKTWRRMLKWKAAEKRQTLTIDSLFRAQEEALVGEEVGENGKKKRTLISAEELNLSQMIEDYGRRVAHDVALSNVLEAAERAGLIRPLRYGEELPKPQEEGSYTYHFTEAPRGAPMLKGWAVENTFKKWLEQGMKTYSYENGAFADHLNRAFSMAKMWQFTKMFIMPFYDTMQWLQRVGPTGVVTIPLYMIRTAHELGYFNKMGQVFTKVFTDPKNILQPFMEDRKVVPWARELNQYDVFSTPYPAPFGEFKNQMAAYLEKTPLKFLVTRSLGKMDPNQKGQTIRDMAAATLQIPYEIAWNVNWSLDHLIRLSHGRQLMDEGHSAADAAQITALMHGAYSHVRPELRRGLNYVFFTPTFKIAMAKVNMQMLRASAKTWLGKETELNTVDQALVKAAPMRGLMYILYGIGINAAIDMYAKAMLGLDDEDPWYRYVKDIEDQEGRPKEIVHIISTPQNLIFRHFSRWWKAFHGTNPFGDLFDAEIYTFHPVIQRFYELYHNKRADGRDIYNPFDGSPLRQSLDVLSWFLNETIPMYEEIFPGAQNPDDATNWYWNQEMKNLYGPIIGKVGAEATNSLTITYERDRLPVRTKAQIDQLTRELYSYIYKAADKGEWSPKKQEIAVQEFRRRVDVLRKELDEYYSR